MTDRDLVNDFLRARSESAFRSLYHAHTQSLFRIAVRLLNGNTDQAEETIQQMWCVAVSKLDEFEWKSSLRTWLCAIMMNLIHEHWRQAMKRGYPIENPVIENNNGLRIDLNKAINDLPEGSQQVFVLHDVEGYKHHEIAEILQINEGTSKSQLSRARAALRKYLR